jgi:4-amino-4-deoxy-L-arabinose transferase-like glycosyltransferase
LRSLLPASVSVFPAQRGIAEVGRSLWWTLAALALLRVASFALYPLMDKTETRYADIARRMLVAHDWITPWMADGVPFWAKPPLSFWATMLSYEVFGINEFAARLPHFLLGVLVAASLWQHARRRSERAAWHSVALLAGSLLFLVSSGAVMTDMALTLGTTLVMVGFWRAVTAEGEDRWSSWQIGAGVAIGLLAKGPVSLILWGLPLGFWAVLTRNLAFAWRRVPWLRGAALVAVLTVPWYVIAERHTPGFLHYFIVGEHLQRFLQPGWTGDLYGSPHQVPRGTVWLYSIAAIMPWPLLAPFLVANARSGEPRPIAASERTYLLAWTLAPGIIFTLAANVLWTYVLPALPALALLAAFWTSTRAHRARVDRYLVIGLAAGCVAVLALIAIARTSTLLDSKSAKSLVLDYRLHEHGEPLYFVGPIPYSGSFYSDGRAQEVREVRDLPTGRKSYVILDEAAWNTLPIDQAARLRLIDTRGGRVLALAQ